MTHGTGEPVMRPGFVGYFGGRSESGRRGRCDACGQEAVLRSFDAREWLRCGPVPFYPLHAWRVFEACPLCGHHRRLPLAEYREWVAGELTVARAALAAAPHDLSQRLQLAWQWIGFGCFEEALAVLTPLLLESAPVAAQHCAGVAYRGLRHYAAAEAAFRAAVQHEPANALYRLDLGRLLLRARGGLAEAETHLAAATAGAPDDLEGWVALARVRTWRQDWPAAWQAWSRCLQLDPGQRGLLAERGLIDRVKRAVGR